ncbi:MAG: hypothetical protein SV760_02580, partial [Halobacteria archaeon]|nr:hypothetical protein [Halobacteria archaeon]
IGVGVAGGVVGGVLVFYGVGFAKPKHRGITHALTTGAVVAGVVGLGVGFAGSELVSPEIGYVAGGIGGLSFFVGFLSHLQCDGLLVGFLPSYSG